MMRREASILKAATVIVAAPRYMGAFSAALGIDLISHWAGFADWEIWSGAAMAVLEGWAIAFIFGRWRSMPPRTMHWWILLYIQIALLLALPATVTPYLIASQLKLPAAQVLGASWLWVWSFLVAAIAPLVIAAVGYTDTEVATDAEKEQLRRDLEQTRQALAEADARFQAAGDLMAALVSQHKKDRIIAASRRWPQLPAGSIAVITESKPSYVSEVLGGING